MIVLGLARALGLCGTVILACLLVLAVTAYGVAQDLGLVDPPAAATPAARVPAPSRAASADIPTGYLRLYRSGARRCPGLSWAVLAAVGKVESNHGRARLPGVRSGWNRAGAAGPMQFGIGVGRAGDLVFPGPGGSNGIPRGARTPLSTHNLRRVYQAAVAAAGEDLAHLDLHGPHDLHHTFATWLEDAGIPSRVIDELMGHTGGRRNGGTGGSPMGRVYRETTPAMLARVTAALDERIGRAMEVVRSPLRDAEGSAGAQAG
jgi:hypothetical protein